MVPRSGALMLATAALMAVSAVCAHSKRAEMSQQPFVIGSRYGRSPGRDRDRVITPRNDRFFMGSRYGKRAESVTTEEDPPSQQQPSLSDEEGRLSGEGVVMRTLYCEYTGVLRLYRCARGKGRGREPAKDITRNVGDPEQSEET